MKASILGISRLRIGTDGNGITTLVAFHGCALGCKYCLNPRCKDSDAKVRKMTPEEVMEELRKDELYYVATKGGVTLGGGEPFLNSLFIKEVLELGAKEWHVTIETSLNVLREYIEPLLPYIDEYIVDIKDMNDEIYTRYTKRSNELVKSNLMWLIDKGCADRIICRIPLIPGFNNETHQEKSKEELEKMGISRFDLFTYKTSKEEEKLLQKTRTMKRGIMDSIWTFFSPLTTGIIPLKDDDYYMNTSCHKVRVHNDHAENEDGMDNYHMPDPLFEEVARLIIKEQKASTSLIQRRFGIGYNRASRLMDELEKAGVVNKLYGSQPRDVLIEDETILENRLNDYCNLED